MSKFIEVTTNGKKLMVNFDLINEINPNSEEYGGTVLVRYYGSPPNGVDIRCIEESYEVIRDKLLEMQK